MHPSGLMQSLEASSYGKSLLQVQENCGHCREAHGPRSSCRAGKIGSMYGKDRGKVRERWFKNEEKRKCDGGAFSPIRYS